MTSTASPTTRLEEAPTPEEFGVGARLSLAVMRDDFVDVILGALAATSADGLVVDTDDVSTFVGGSEQDIVRWLVGVLAHAAGSGAQVVLLRQHRILLPCHPIRRQEVHL